MITETAQDPAARRKLLADLSAERRLQARHNETLRSNVASSTVAISSGLIAVITHNKIDRSDLTLSILLIVIGCVGVASTLTYIERYHRHRNRASRLLRALDEMTDHGGEKTVFEIEEEADQRHKERTRFALIRCIGSSHWLWLVFPAIIAAVGIVLTVVAAT